MVSRIGQGQLDSSGLIEFDVQGSDQTKLLVDSQQYMNGSADGRYGVGGIGVEGVNASNGGQNPFYQVGGWYCTVLVKGQNF